MFLSAKPRLRAQCFALPGKTWVRIPRAERVELARKRQAWISSLQANILVPHSTRSAFCFCLQNCGFKHSVLPSPAKRGFAYLARRSTSSLVRRRAWVSSLQANILVPLQKNPTQKSWIFSFVPQGTTSFAWHTQHHLTVRSTSLPPRVAQINEVEALPQIMLQQVANDVMLRINDVALHANGYAFISKNRLAVRRCRNDKEQKNDINICFTRDWTEVSFKAIRF